MVPESPVKVAGSLFSEEVEEEEEGVVEEEGKGG